MITKPVPGPHRNWRVAKCVLTGLMRPCQGISDTLVLTGRRVEGEVSDLLRRHWGERALSRLINSAQQMRGSIIFIDETLVGRYRKALNRHLEGDLLGRCRLGVWNGSQNALNAIVSRFPGMMKDEMKLWAHFKKLAKTFLLHYYYIIIKKTLLLPVINAECAGD